MEAGTYDQVRSSIRTQDARLASRWRALCTRACGIFSDETLARRARQGDHVAFEALVARYRGRLYAMAFSALGDEGEAVDARCETVVSAFRDIDSISAKWTPGTWLSLHGLRAVLRRMDMTPGRYTVESRPAVGVAPRD